MTLPMKSALRFLVAWGLATSCTAPFQDMDSFQIWEIASTDFRAALSQEALDEFADLGHALAYAIATDCFQTIKPSNPLDEAIRDACQTEVGLLSDVMTMNDLCESLDRDGNKNVPEINGARVCG